MVDSLVLEELSEVDRNLLDSCLKLYHKAEHDTDKVNAINVIVEESWDENAHPLVSINTILKNVLNTGCKFVVITGGEPTLYNLSYLTTALKTNGIEIAIETSGTNPLRGEISWVTFSPKKFKAPLEDYYQFSDELKVVVYHPSDLKWAEEHAGKMKSNCRFYLQPEWSKMDELMPEILNYIKLNPKWNLSLQSHKFINIP